MRGATARVVRAGGAASADPDGTSFATVAEGSPAAMRRHTVAC